MMTGPRKAILGALLAIAGFAAGAGFSYAQTGGDEAARIARGGRLYDDWGKEIGADHLRQAERSQDKAKPLPGRCVDCHGWDYRGKDGAAGRFGQPGLVKGVTGKAGAELSVIAPVLGNETHGYQDVLKKEDIEDLALFVARGQVDMDGLIEAGASRAKGWAPNGNVYFQTICANCHGNDGQAIVDARPLGDVARENPWQATHTLFNGHPGGSMPALRVLDRSTLMDVLAYIQVLPSRDLLASIVRGGRLYDTWYKENGQDAPEGVHPAYAGALPQGVEPRTTWRCKECHGWDYRGKDGVSNSGEHKTSAVGVHRFAGGDAREIAPKFMDARHGFGKLLSPRDQLDLANFIARGQIDMDEFIDRATRKARGQADRYAAHYQTICATCHGADGRLVRTMPPLGRIAANDPWRALHGILNGHPGEPMPPLMALPRAAAIGILTYSQSLPTQR